MLWRAAQQAHSGTGSHWDGRHCVSDCPAVRARRSHRGTRCVRCALYAQTAAMSMLTKCAARTDPRALLLGAPQIARAAVHLPRRWAAGLRDVGARTSPQPSTPAGVAGGCAGLLKGFAHATESRAPASGVAPTAWCAATPSARDCKQNGADTRRAGPGLGIALAEVPMTAMGGLRPAAFQTVQSRSISDRQRINIDGPAQQAFSVRPLAQAVQYAVPGAQECL